MENNRALVVDDDEDVAEILAIVLRKHGYETQTASSGKEALAKCQIESFDVILSDIGMPQMNGYELVRELRACGHKATTIVAVTGLSIYDDRKRAINLGFDEVVTKPVAAETLMVTIARLRKAKK